MAEGPNQILKGQICQEFDYFADKPCQFLYTRCRIPCCTGIRQIMETHTEANNERKFLKCQYLSCTGFQWLDEAITEVRGSSSSTTRLQGCFHCGCVGHWKKDCPWIATCCKNCGGVVALKVSGKKGSEGRRYLKCGTCAFFVWFVPEDRQLGNFKMTLEWSLDDFCSMFKNKLSYK